MSVFRGGNSLDPGYFAIGRGGEGGSRKVVVVVVVVVCRSNSGNSSSTETALDVGNGDARVDRRTVQCIYFACTANAGWATRTRTQCSVDESKSSRDQTSKLGREFRGRSRIR